MRAKPHAVLGGTGRPAPRQGPGVGSALATGVLRLSWVPVPGPSGATVSLGFFPKCLFPFNMYVTKDNLVTWAHWVAILRDARVTKAAL